MVEIETTHRINNCENNTSITVDETFCKNTAIRIDDKDCKSIMCYLNPTQLIAFKKIIDRVLKEKMGNGRDND